ncbi:MAG: hypothetical protein DCC73_02555 [Proteobacteria bacterium]|nr:MAG: hypothetical protein DCC73_02555 [Pseudomonadota bacterium]
MTERQRIEAALARAPGGLPEGAFDGRERAAVAAVLARRFPGFQIAAGASKAQVVTDLVEFLLSHQRR